MWSKRSFRGIYFPAEPVANFQIESFPLPKKVVLPMEQHPGGMCDVVVSTGDQVKVGQVIGASDRFDEADVHASVSGMVTDIRPWPGPHGHEVLSVVVESDGQNEWIETPERDQEFLSRRPSALLDLLRHSGIIEIGMPAMPLHVKLSPPERPKSYLFLVGIPVLKKVDTLIVTAVDLEPFVFVRRAILYNNAPVLVEGIQAIKKIVGAKNAVLALSGADRFPEEVLMPFLDAGIELFWASSKYPSGLEPILVKQFTGKEIPMPNGNARDLGVLLQDVVTVMNVITAIRDQRPQVRKLITVSGHGVSRPRNLVVRIGTPVREVMSFMGIPEGSVKKVIIGGPLMGYAQYTLDVPITKEAYALVCQGHGGTHVFEPDPCFNCGACVRTCPVNLMPNELSKYCEFGRFEDAERHWLFHCIECGLCAYVCPAKRPMVHFMRYGKSEIIARRVGV